MKFLMSRPFVLSYDNNIDALIPQLWAQEALAILEENMVAANLVNRNYENTFAKYGDIVHVNRPGEFVAKRKTVNDNITIQNATATDIQVPLNQHVHVSFLIRDGEETIAFENLVQKYMYPAMLAEARFIDRVLLGQYPRFLANQYGTLRGLNSGNVKDRILGTRSLMNVNKAYVENRQMILGPTSETVALSLSEFTQAQDLGDGGFALREAWLGRKFGFNTYMSQNMPEVAPGNTVITGAINNAAGYGAGTTSITVDGLSAAITAGTFLTIAGDDVPQQVVSTTGGATPTAIVLLPGLKHAVTDNAVITLYSPGAVNLSGGYAVGWAKEIVVDGFTVAPQTGQMIAIGTDSTNLYSVIQATTTTILLDRPLEAAIADNATINIGPAGSYNFTFNRDALTLVVRPLMTPMRGTGALSSVVNFNNLSMRAVITYDGSMQGHIVTLDMLCGVQVLDQHLGAVMLG